MTTVISNEIPDPTMQSFRSLHQTRARNPQIHVRDGLALEAAARGALADDHLQKLGTLLVRLEAAAGRVYLVDLEVAAA